MPAPGRGGLLAALVCIAPNAARADGETPSGAATVEALAGPGGPTAAEVRAEVRRTGFHAGAPVGAAQCARCHPDVAAQWAASAHRFASFNNPYYAAAINALRDEQGPRASRFCANCHDPLLVADGAIDGPVDASARAAQAGLACLVCHSIPTAPDLRGNGLYALRPDPVPPPGTPAHKARLRPAFLDGAAFCATCHKVGLTEEVTGARWLRGQDEYDAWYDSAASGRGVASVFRPPRASTCRDCHMPLEDAVLGDQAAHEGRIRSHRFAAANAALAHLRGDADQEERVKAFLRGAVSLDLMPAPAGGPAVDVVLRARRIGHRFPAGTGDSNEAWLEVVALDGDGRPIGASGQADARGAVDPAAHRIRPQPVDGMGRPIARRDVQHMRGAAFDTSLAPSDPQAVRFELPDGTRRVRARLLYRKFDRDYLAFACAAVPEPSARARCEQPPAVEIAAAERDLDARAEPAWERLLDHGLALADALVDRGREAEPVLARAAALAPDRPEPALGLARLALAMGRTDDLIAILDGLDARAAGAAPHPASLWLRAVGLHRAYRDRPALVAAEALAARFPDDRNALGLLARLRGLLGDAAGSLEAADRLLAVDPESEEGLYQRTLALRELGRDARDAEARWLRHRRATELDLALRRAHARTFPALEDESFPVHAHRIVAAPPGANRGGQ